MPDQGRAAELEKLYQELYRSGTRPQEAVGPQWRSSHATWFLAMGLGGGLYLYRLVIGLSLGTFLGLPLTDLLSIILVGIGGAILIADLGHPERFMKAVAHARTSWIARGAIADFVLMIVGGLAILPYLQIGGFKPFDGLKNVWTLESTLGLVLQGIAWVAAVIVMLYVGFVLYGSNSVPLWQLREVPILLPLTSLTASLGLAFLVAPATQLTGVPLKSVALLEIAMILLTLLFTASLLRSAPRNGSAAKESARTMTRGSYAAHFIGGVLIVGNVLPLLALGIAYMTSGALEVGAMALSGLLVIVGAFLLRYVLLKAALFGPPNYHSIRTPGPA